MNDSVETAGETGGRHPGHPGLNTVNEEAGHNVFHTGHVEHDMNDDMGERTKTMQNITKANGKQTDVVIENERTEAEAEGIAGTSTETTPNAAVETAGGTGEGHSELSTVNKESGHIVGGEHHARCAHPDEEAGSIVLHVSNDMSEEEIDGEEAGETAAAKETEEISKDDAVIRRLIEERKSTPKEEKQRLQEVSKCITNVSEKKKSEKDSKTSKKILEDFEGVKNIPGIKYAKKRVLITKIKYEKGETITSRKGIANVFVEFYKKFYDDKKNLNKKSERTKNESSTDVHNNNTNEMTKIPEITTEELRTAINKLKKANPQTATESEPKTSKHATMGRDKW